MYSYPPPPSFRISHEGIRAGRHNGECHFRKAGGCPPCNAITPVPNIPYPGIVCKHNFPVPISIFHSSLNTDLQNVSGLKFIDFGRYDYNTITVDDCIKDILRRTPVNDQYTYFGRFVRGQEFKVIVQSYPTGDYNSLILFGYASELTYYTKSPGGIAKHEIKCTSMFI